jgi:hypothetical protein
MTLMAIVSSHTATPVPPTGAIADKDTLAQCTSASSRAGSSIASRSCCGSAKSAVMA